MNPVFLPVLVDKFEISRRLRNGRNHFQHGRSRKPPPQEDMRATAEKRTASGEDPRFEFQGDRRDEHTGLVDMGARLYSPELGRFTTTDPLTGSISDPTSLNRYIYGAANPTSSFDPTGLREVRGTTLDRGRSSMTTSTGTTIPQAAGQVGPSPSNIAVSTRVPSPRAIFQSAMRTLGIDDLSRRQIGLINHRALMQDFRQHMAAMREARVLSQCETFAASVLGVGWCRNFIAARESHPNLAAGAAAVIEAGPIAIDLILGSKLALGRLASRTLARRGSAAIVRYNADFAIAQLTRGRTARASELVDFAVGQGWKNASPATGPIRFIDQAGIRRLTIKSGSARTPGSGFPHVEMRNAAGHRIDAFGNTVTRKSPGNHTPIWWDL